MISQRKAISIPAASTCEQLSIKVEGDPHIMTSCNCIQCQKSIGSTFGVSSYFRGKQVLETRGEYTTGSHIAGWGHIGIDVGFFGDHHFSDPTAAA